MRCSISGSSITWNPDEIRAGRIAGTSPGDEPVEISWEEAAQDPGWCKLDWVVADPTRHKLDNASNMLDVTWEAPDGSVTPLDGYLDPYFQEVYLDADAAAFHKTTPHYLEFKEKMPALASKDRYADRYEGVSVPTDKVGR